MNPVTPASMNPFLTCKEMSHGEGNGNLDSLELSIWSSFDQLPNCSSTLTRVLLFHVGRRWETVSNSVAQFHDPWCFLLLRGYGSYNQHRGMSDWGDGLTQARVCCRKAW